MKKASIITGICIAILTIIYYQYTNNALHDPRGSSFAGSEACVKCHGNLCSAYLHTAHYLASLPATEKTVHGSFINGANQFSVNENQKVIMENRDSGMFQTYYLKGKLKERYRFDIVFGGIKGESYLNWKGNELCQLPLSYFSSQHEWSSSPGYGFDFLDYPSLRTIRKRCLECHASYINNIQKESPEITGAEQFDKSTLIYSIDCERCHGPAKQHVEYQMQNPIIKTSKFITTYGSLTRRQKIDMCAVCHSGNPGIMLRSTFGFKPGDNYAAFKVPEFYSKTDTDHLDVHGNQVLLLESSKCFIKSGMNCATCHDLHQDSRGNNNLFAQKCLSCHNKQGHTYCKMAKELSNDVLKANCISCHMPALTSKKISVRVSEKTPSIPFYVRTHHIAVYPEEMKKILAYIDKKF